MRIKIPNKGLCTTNYFNGGGGNPVVEEVAAKMDVAEEQTLQLLVAEANDRDDNLAPLAIPPTPSPAAKEKRKMKTKELYNDICYATKRRGRKPSVTKSKDVVQSSNAGKPTRQLKTTITRSRSSLPEVATPAMIQAEELHSSLGSEFPSFIRFLLRSHVASCFWMGLPRPFCQLHLPKSDTVMILEDESGEQSELKYMSKKSAFSGGWRTFATSHNLLAGDVLIFQLVEPLKFKVYIVRAKDHNEVDRTLSLVSFGASSEQDNTGKHGVENGNIPETNKKRKCEESLQLATVQKKAKRSPRMKSAVVVNHVPFKDIRSFNDFHIQVNDVCIDSELPHHIRYKYYKLCRRNNAFVHGRLLQGLNSKLIAGVISETVNIADAIRACKLTTSREDFETWEKTLRSFELMGVKVGFLRAHIRCLLGLAFGSEDAKQVRKFAEAKIGRAKVEGEIKRLEAKVVELKGVYDKYCADMEDLESEAERYEKKFQEEVDAPWW